ncbi:hypothetical protein FRC02_002386 [Tulasnella sp. 418]|nr:hypothetical protein FRC02_002386 [Tulasnella sp. 418]
MRRLIKQAFHKDKDKGRARSPSPTPVQSESKPKQSVPPKASAKKGPLGDGYTALKANHKALEQDALAESTKGLIGLLEIVDTAANPLLLTKLDNELKLLSDILKSHITDENIAQAGNKRTEILVGDIDSATDKARTYLSQSASSQTKEKLANPSAISSLTEDLHDAVETFKAKVVVRLSADTRREEPSSTSKARVVSGRVVGVLKVVKESLDGVPVPGLKAAVGGFLQVLESINKYVDNDEDLEKLVRHIDRLIQIVTPPPGTKPEQIDVHLQKRIDDLTIDIQVITSEAKKLQIQSRANKLMGNLDNASTITGLIRAVDAAIDRFQVAGSIWVERQLGKLGEIVGAMRSEFGWAEARALSAAQEAALEAIRPRAYMAKYNAASDTPPSFCFPNTRVTILEEISQWVNKPDAHPLFWLSGMAGTGKSTIARTVAKILDDKGLLGASFFFSRDTEELRSINRLFPTIAYQLGRSQPSFRDQLIAAAHPDVCNSMMRTQLEKMIVGPFKTSTKPSLSPIVIVIDGLDECSNDSQITEMIILLSSALQDLRPHVNLKVLVTGRPETHIQSQFMKPGMDLVSSISQLHDIDKSIVGEDIHLYLTHRLNDIGREELSAGISWPEKGDVDALVKMADGLFIFAQVAINYIRPNPVERLPIILSGAHHEKAQYAFKQLDALYRRVLETYEAHDEGDDPKEARTKLNILFGTIAVLLDPLSTESLEQLLGMKQGTIKPRLRLFHSLLSVQDPPQPVRIFHKSFPDFLMDSQRSGRDSWFYIDDIEHHTRVALLCLNHMNSLLKRDMCNTGNTLNSDIENRDEVLEASVPRHLLYACQYWASHLNVADQSKELIDALNEFCSSKLLYWLEILSIADKLNEGVYLLSTAKDWCRRYNPESQPILDDSYRFLLFFREAIAQGPIHIYKSALPFIPDCELFSAVQEKLEDCVTVKSTRGREWNPLLFKLTGHTDWVRSVAFSSDGNLVASGSNDKTVGIWNAKTGALIRTLKGHKHTVNSVAFSPDGTRLASGSRDKTISIWDAKTGALIMTLTGHTDSVTSVAYSPDGLQIASGSDDKTVGVWDALAGILITVLQGHTQWVNGVAFSSDGSQIASGSDDKTIVIWDVEKGEIVRTLKGHTDSVVSVAFSPDKVHLVTSSNDKTAAIWDVTTGALVKRLKGHGDYVRSATYLDNGTQIATGSNDKTVTIWNPTTGRTIRILKGHTDYVRSVAFSPDGTHIASGAGDNTVAVWDARSSAPSEELKGHTAQITSITFSPDGMWIASGSYDQTINVWDARTGAHVKMLEGHEVLIESLLFTSDSLFLMSKDASHQIIFWNMDTLEQCDPSPTGNTMTLASSQDSGNQENKLSIKERWIMGEINGEQQPLCYLMQHDITTFASSGSILVYGTESGGLYILDFSSALSGKPLTI